MQGKPRFGIDAPTLVLGFATGVPLLLLASLFHGFAPVLAWTMREIARVLKPGGQLALLDFRHTARYAETLRAAGLDVRRSRPLFLMFPWVWIVRGRKP